MELRDALDQLPPPDVLAIAALTVLAAEKPASDDPWDQRDQWWVNTDHQRILPFTDGETAYPVAVVRSGAAWRMGGKRSLPSSSLTQRS